MPGILMEAFLRVEVAGIVVTVDEKTTGRLLYKMHFVFFQKNLPLIETFLTKKRLQNLQPFSIYDN